MTPAPDAGLRQRALDPARSFLVQAPAGAGKTELLIQRYLRLLATVDEPEEVLAVTFTRKAAGEMRGRVIAALTAPAPAEGTGSASVTAGLARAAGTRDAERGWNLAQHPVRLRIGTIDSLNAWIARSAPAAGGASAWRTVLERPAHRYRQAARALVERLGSDEPAGEAVGLLLQHLDNRLDRLEALVAALLGHRDQWLPFIGRGIEPGQGRVALEAALERLVTRELDALDALLPVALRDEVAAVMALAEPDPAAPVQPAQALGGVTDLRLAAWQDVALTFLTRTGQWRASVNKSQGFPAGGAARARAMALRAELARVPGLEAALKAVAELPPPRYSDEQWQALAALLVALPAAAAELKLVLAAAGETDFIEIAADAMLALGPEEEPGDMGLRLDARIRHILLDEFQDTSQAQFRLIRALTRGWAPGDGRTLFLVGDPMQSIYRFRQAEVRLFLAVRREGIQGLPLEFLRLEANFRSVPRMVDWANQAFPLLMPPTDEPLSGAVAFAPALAVRPAEPDTGAFLHDCTGVTGDEEGERVAALVRDSLRRWPDGTIGVLVRSRAHAADTLRALERGGIGTTAVELLQLGSSILANDLVALVRALVHRGDRLAWLGVLRAPWCGLTLADLEALAGADRGRPVWELLNDTATLARLSADGRSRVLRLRTAWERAERRRGQLDLRDLAEGLWRELGGPAVAGVELPQAEAVFAAVAAHEQGGDLPDPDSLAAELASRPASLASASTQVQVLTIHKAKGLQFDTVIVPGLGRPTRQDRRPALLWEELTLEGSVPALLLAPITGADTQDDPLYELLWRLRREQADAEADRLLYVAATRAVRRLHLLGHLETGPGGELRPAVGSLLHRLWPAVSGSWPVPTAVPGPDPGSSATANWRQPVLRRLPAGWSRPPPAPPVDLAGTAVPEPDSQHLVFDWASLDAMHAGAVVHRWLQHIAGAGIERFTPERLRALAPVSRRLLHRLGVGRDNLDRATTRVTEALLRTLDDEHGRWILAGSHPDCRNEYPIALAEGQRVRHLVVDRTFVSDGVRWVIDYKTSSHEGADLAAFLAQEADRYRDQLDAYRTAMALLDPSMPVRTALYFPLLGCFHEVAG